MFSQSSVNIPVALILILLAGSLAQRVKVQPEVVSYPGQLVTLPCQFPDPGQTQLTQVSWSFETAADIWTNIAAFHSQFGVIYIESPLKGRVSFTTYPPLLESPAIQISDIKMTDEGRYICEFAIYPSGNEQGVTNLVILAKPSNTASTVTVQAGTAPVIVAHCQSANGHPPANISWGASVGGNGTTWTEKDNQDRTVTVKSEYWLVPTPADNGRDVSCEVSHRTLSSPETFPMKLRIEYPPQVQIVGYDSNWYLGRTNAVLTCQAQGNPPPTTFTWRTTSGQMPETVQVKQNTLTVLKVDETVNTTFICEVRNHVGTGTDQVSVMVRATFFHTDADNRTSVYAASGVAVVLLLIFTAVFLWMRRRAAVTSRETEKSREGASAPVYDEVSTLAVTSDTSRAAWSDDQDDVQYASVHFSRSQTKDVPLNSTVHPSNALPEEEEVQYAAVNTAKPRTARKDETLMYGTVQKSLRR